MRRGPSLEPGWALLGATSWVHVRAVPELSVHGALCHGGAASGEEEGKLVQTSPARLSGSCGWGTVACRQGLGYTQSRSTRSLRNDHSHGLQGSQSISPLKCPGLNSDGSPTLGDGVMESGRNETAPVG